MGLTYQNAGRFLVEESAWEVKRMILILILGK
jgi:hypothetical protein